MSGNRKRGRAVLIDGKAYVRAADGSQVPAVGRTDFARLDAMSAEEIESGAVSDADALTMSDDDWAAAEVAKPAKVAMTMKLDSDVLDWFRGNGKGYQTRINAVLRRYMEAQKKAG